MVAPSTLPALSSPFPALLALLLGETSLTDLVTGGDVSSAHATEKRIYIGGLPTPLAANTRYEQVLPPTVVVRGAGLVGRADVPGMQAGQIALRCYDIDEASARALWYVVLNLLRAKTPTRHNGVTVAIQGGHSGPFDDQEPNGGFLMATGTIPVTVFG
jgi:hypothetical protein